jgi:hypothetical protein
MAANPTARPHWTLKAFIICEGLAFCYGLPLLGLAENFAPKPFANLRVHGGNGTNHFFAPTNLGASLGIPIPSQEVVRVESTTSDRLNALWPAEMSFYLNDGHTRQLLEQVGHSGRIFEPAAARLIGTCCALCLNECRCLALAKAALRGFQLVNSTAVKIHVADVCSAFCCTCV